MKLNRYNYEEYFILYTDNELSSEDRREVELFVDANPDLKEELEMLLHTHMTPDMDISFNGKELLMARNSSSIGQGNYEGWLLSYVDDELTAEERKDVENFVAAHPEVQAELNLLQRSKLQPEAISFPYKNSLYRTEEKVRVIAISWRRLAVAAAFLVAVSTVALVMINQSKNETIAGNGKQGSEENIVKTPATSPSTQDAVKEEADIADNSNPGKATTSEEISTAATKQVIAAANNNNDRSNAVQEEKKAALVLPTTLEDNDNIASADGGQKRSNNLTTPTHNPNVVSIEAIAKNDPARSPLTNHNGITGNSDVTNKSSQPSDNSTMTQGEQANNPDAIYANNSENNNGKKGGGLRGFFRKVTRTVAKNANLESGDDDDRVMIAGLAIKLN